MTFETFIKNIKEANPDERIVDNLLAQIEVAYEPLRTAGDYFPTIPEWLRTSSLRRLSPAVAKTALAIYISMLLTIKTVADKFVSNFAGVTYMLDGTELCSFRSHFTIYYICKNASDPQHLLQFSYALRPLYMSVDDIKDFLDKGISSILNARLGENEYALFIAVPHVNLVRPSSFRDVYNRLKSSWGL